MSAALWGYNLAAWHLLSELEETMKEFSLRAYSRCSDGELTASDATVSSSPVQSTFLNRFSINNLFPSHGITLGHNPCEPRPRHRLRRCGGELPSRVEAFTKSISTKRHVQLLM